ncbi:MAG: zinc ribbon domain-containing protein [Chloroflexi bacterium]|nr:zinc ribbon domain-containing protein [Chloroflexota bacterium]OJV94538.1 MAG: hypothetical protein BGO39_22630 [Chloroflexi bacterium 54-19]
MPQEILNQLQNVFNTAISILQVVATFLIAFLVVLWMTLCFWTFRDIQARTRDLLAQIFATLLVFFFNIPGVLLYILVRPKETLVQAYERSLQEEYMLQDLEEREICPTCRVKTQPDYSYCFNCRTRLRRECNNCGSLIKLKWASCPFCGTPQKSRHRETVAATAGGLGAPRPQPPRPAQQPISTALAASTSASATVDPYLSPNGYEPVINGYDQNPASAQAPNLPPLQSQAQTYPADGGETRTYVPAEPDPDYIYRPRATNGNASVTLDDSTRPMVINPAVPASDTTSEPELESLAPDLPNGEGNYTQATQKFDHRKAQGSKPNLNGNGNGNGVHSGKGSNGAHTPGD